MLLHDFVMFRVTWISLILVLIILLMCTLIALILYAKYNQCDPLRAKLIGKPDQVKRLTYMY